MRTFSGEGELVGTTTDLVASAAILVARDIFAS